MRGSSVTVSWCRYDETSGRVSLVIPDLGPGDEGVYQCRADNPYGDSTCTITVRSAGCKKVKKCNYNWLIS